MDLGVTLLDIALSFHWIPVFHNWQVFDDFLSVYLFIFFAYSKSFG